MLYVGFLEAPFSRAKYETLLTILIAFVVVTAVSVPIFLRWARGIFKPLERMTDTIARVEDGDLGARTALPPAEDEIGLVAHHLDHLLDIESGLLAEMDALGQPLHEAGDADLVDHLGELA